VAGVTDWTAAGGHGSDTTLRTSESLANATGSLKPDTSSAPENPKAARHRMAAEADEKRGDALLAVEEFEKAATIDPSEQNEFEWASDLLLHRAISQAETVFRKGAGAYPKSLRMQAGLGAALFAGARYEDAAAQMCKASDLDPTDPNPYLMIGKIAVAAPNPLDCVEPKLARFVQLHPESPTANYLYAMALLKAHPAEAQRLDVAKKSLDKAITVDPKCSGAYLELGILAAAQQDNRSAIHLYKAAIDADPESADAHYRLGVAYDRTGDHANAEREFILHKQIEQKQAAETEAQRKAVKQFLFATPNDRSSASAK
jgi:tetratricopeptide (TPR) repeat protein